MRALSAVLMLLSVMLLGCNRREEWGTPEYFERLIGVRFTPATPPVTCSDDSGPGLLAFRLVQLPGDVADKLRGSGAALQGFPRQLSSDQQSNVQPWTHGALSTDAREAFDRAVIGAATAIEQSPCRTMKSGEVLRRVRDSLAKETTWHSYERASAEALEFRVLDPVDRVLYELVNAD
jgi:hypothetical protein